MNAEQRALYFGLWHDACKVTGWDAKDDGQRREMHFQAINRNKSSKDLTHPELTKVLNYLRGIVEGTSIARQVRVVQDREQDESVRRQMLHSITRLAEDLAVIRQHDADAYVRAVTRDIHDTHRLEELDAPALTQLRNLLANRVGKAISAMKKGKLANTPGYNLRLSNKELISRMTARQTAKPVVEMGGAPRQSACNAVAPTMQPGRYGFILAPAAVAKPLTDDPF